MSHVELETELEQLIDSHGLLRVLDTISNICHDKAEHLRSNWQDERTAKVWDKAGKIIDQSRGNCDIAGIV